MNAKNENMRLGYIDYLNCYPFYYYMMRKTSIHGVEVVSGYPSDLNKMMINRELDMSPISSAAYSDMQDRVVLLPYFCLSSVGYVRSVLLISKIPIEELNKRKVGLSSASLTSMVLIKILLNKFYNIVPKYIQTPPSPCLDDVDAALIIGNEALINMKDPVPYIYDLGDLWLRKTGFPVVFAIFAVQIDALNKYKDKINKVVESYRESLQCLNTDRDNLISSARKRYPDINYDIDKYYSLLKFDLTHEFKRSLEFYFHEASELGILKRVKSLNFITFDM